MHVFTRRAQLDIGGTRALFFGPFADGDAVKSFKLQATSGADLAAPTNVHVNVLAGVFQAPGPPDMTDAQFAAHPQCFGAEGTLVDPNLPNLSVETQLSDPTSPSPQLEFFVNTRFGRGYRWFGVHLTNPDADDIVNVIVTVDGRSVSGFGWEI